MDLWTILNSNLVILLVGFLLTTIAGGLISSWIQRSSWERQTRVDLYRKRYEEGSQFLNELSKLIGTRCFQMQRYLWAIEDLPEERLSGIEKEYFKTVAEWNATYWMNRNKTRLFVGEAQANLFLDYTDDRRIEDPVSIHYRFVKAHQNVIGVKNKSVTAKDAQRAINQLNIACSNFLEVLTTSFLERAASLQLLSIPQLSKGPESKRGKT